MNERKREDYQDEIYRVEQRRQKVNNEEQLRLQTFLDKEGMEDMRCPSCKSYIGDNMKKWVKGTHGESYICRKCFERYCELRKVLQERQGLKVGSNWIEDQPKFICLSCQKEYPPLIDKKLSMRSWLFDPEDGWICISCKIRKHRKISEELHYTSHIVLPYTFLINGWCFRVVRMRLQDLLANEEDPEERIKISVEELAEEASTIEVKMTKDIWYQLENGHTKTIKRKMWESVRYVFHQHGYDIEVLMADYENNLKDDK